MSQENFYTTANDTSGIHWSGGGASGSNLVYEGHSLTPTWYHAVLETPTFASIKLNEPLKEGIEMKNLYEVFLVYGEDRKAPVISATERVIANDDEDARVKSGIYSKVDKEWDADYLTILVRNLGAVKIKERAKEVKNV